MVTRRIKKTIKGVAKITGKTLLTIFKGGSPTTPPGYKPRKKKKKFRPGITPPKRNR